VIVKEFFDSVLNAMKGVFKIRLIFSDILDIAIVTLIVYGVILLIRRTRAGQLVKGIIISVLSYFIAVQLGLKTVKYIFSNLFQIGLLALIVVFQPEIRRALEQMGRGGFSFFSNRFVSQQFSMWHRAIVDICESVEYMSQERTGALIVIERNTGLNEIVGTGTEIDSEISSEILETIFYLGSPLHDGAVIIRDGRVRAAGCLLPLSSNFEISRDMGTRHRAALGMSETSDAIVIVVSEETGIVSVAQNGVIIRKVDNKSLFRMLSIELMPSENEEKPNRKKWRLFGK